MRFPLCFLVVCLAAGASPRAESLHGRVVDRASLATASTGKGVGGAKLVLFDSTGRKVGMKATGKSGAYAFAKLVPGIYTLSIARKEYQPSPLLRVIALQAEDTLSRDFLIDRMPARNGVPLRAQNAPAAGKRKAKSTLPYHPQLAEGMLASLSIPSFHREAERGPITLGRFHDAEDTSLAYRALWAALMWSEIESQDRPTESMVYLAHAYDSTLRGEGIPAPAALKAWLKADPDSTEALALTARAMMLSPNRKDKHAALAKKSVPKSLTLDILEECFRASAPRPKKKAFLAKIKSLIGPDAARRFALIIEPPKKRQAAKAETPAGPPRPDMDKVWKVIVDAASGRNPNPAALYHVAVRKAETGKAREAVADLDRLASLRPDDPKSVHLLAGLRLWMGDTADAAALYDSLARVESPEWAAKGFRASARIHWRAGRGEPAERALWRAMGLDARGPGARSDVLLLAAISLSRDSWRPVEPLLDSLVKTRPREAEAWYWLGRIALLGKQDGVALDRFRRAASLAPKRTEFASALAAAHFAREECAAALKALQPVRSSLDGEGLSILGQCLLQQGRSKEAVSEFARLNATKPGPANLAAYARALTAARRAPEAVELIQASPFAGDYGARKALAEAHLAQGLPGRARQALDPMVLEHGEDADLHYLLGKAAFGLREYPEASRLLTAALRYREDYPEAKYLQGMSLLKQGRSGEARHYFLELKDMDKASWKAKGLLGQGQAFAREEKPEAAEENLRKSFQAVPSAEAGAHLALALLKQGKNAEAAEWAAKARKLDPDEPLALMASVDALLADHREADAVALAQSGLDAHPEGCDFLVVAAKARLRAGQDAEAAELSRRASGLCPEESAPYFYLGTLSARAGTVKEARRLFAEYMRTGGDAKRVPIAYR